MFDDDSAALDSADERAVRRDNQHVLTVRIAEEDKASSVSEAFHIHNAGAALHKRADVPEQSILRRI